MRVRVSSTQELPAGNSSTHQTWRCSWPELQPGRTPPPLAKVTRSGLGITSPYGSRTRSTHCCSASRRLQDLPLAAISVDACWNPGLDLNDATHWPKCRRWLKLLEGRDAISEGSLFASGDFKPPVRGHAFPRCVGVGGASTMPNSPAQRRPLSSLL
jgi:hypothetical protein